MNEDGDLGKVRLGELVSRRQTDSLPPPLVADILPCGKLSPPVFERLVGETMWLVDGMNDIRGYGRSGQDQGGLDLIGRKDGTTHVYQIRRIVSLSPQALRKAVTDFAGPSRTKTPEREWIERRFDAVRFVLAVGCEVEDTAVEDELVTLQELYKGDLELELYDAGALTRFLRDRPSVVAGVFGPEWAKALYGLDLPETPSLPHGYALLNDPLEHLGLAGALARAEAVAETEPCEAAVLMADLVGTLTDAGYRAHAGALRNRHTALLETAGDLEAALLESAGILMDRHDEGRLDAHELTQAKRLAADVEGAAAHVCTVLQALADWYLGGYDLDPVVGALNEIVEAGLPLAGRLVLAVAEQVVVDDDPADNPQDLHTLLDTIADAQPAEIRVRMRCCSADLAIRAGTPTLQAYADLVGRALSGYIPERFASLVLMRQGRALAMADEGGEATEAYRRAVLAAMRAGLGADARYALRSISLLAHQFSFGPDGFGQSANALLGARTIGTREEGLIQDVFDPAVTALEALLAGKAPSAVRAARRWVWQETLGGCLADEQIARRRLGQAWELAGMPDLAVRQFTCAGARDKAVAAAKKAKNYVDVGRFLAGPRWVRQAAAAVIEQQADLVPDQDIDRIAQQLVDLVVSGPPHGSSMSDPVRHATGALAAFGHRIPQASVTRIFPTVLTWLPREPGHYRFTDQQMLGLLSACVEADLTEAGQAVDALWEAVKLNIHRAEHHLVAAGTHRHRVEQELSEHAAGADGFQAAAILASWGVDDPAVERVARQLAADVLSEPVGSERGVYTTSDVPVLCAGFLAAVAAHKADAPNDIEELRETVAQQLLAWGQDTLDVAERRVTALRALAELAPTLPDSVRSALVDPLIVLNSRPGSHPLDEFEQQSQHPLSTFKITTDGLNLGAAALHAAAKCATTPEQAATIERLALAHITRQPESTSEARLYAETLRTIELLRPVPVHLIATHPAPHMRQCAVVCWDHRRQDSDPAQAQAFADDADTGVRVNLAHVLGRLPLEERGPYSDVLDQLHHDRSARVRKAAAEAPQDQDEHRLRP